MKANLFRPAICLFLIFAVLVNGRAVDDLGPDITAFLSRLSIPAAGVGTNSVWSVPVSCDVCGRLVRFEEIEPRAPVLNKTFKALQEGEKPLFLLDVFSAGSDSDARNLLAIAMGVFDTSLSPEAFASSFTSTNMGNGIVVAWENQPEDLPHDAFLWSGTSVLRVFDCATNSVRAVLDVYNSGLQEDFAQ